MQTSSTPEAAMLFIPDISGFTHFVNDTEITHSQHIIEELTSVIIDTNTLDLRVAEIEGDAVLFYRRGAAPDAAALFDQIQQMFIAFHAHLKRYETHRICQCGACCGAINLTLKFFCHYGEVTMNRAHKTEKPFGRHVILIHRLMKNRISGSEYALFTNELMEACINWENLKDSAWSILETGEETYDTGEVRFCFIALNSLLRHVPAPAITDYGIPNATLRLVRAERMVEAPMELVFDVVSDLGFRHHWLVGLKGSDRMNHQIMQPGSTHRCVIKGRESDPFMHAHDFKISDNTITFVESNHRDGNSTIFQFHRMGKGLTKVQTTVLVIPNPIKMFLFNLLMKKKFLKIFKQQLENLNNYCKGLVQEAKEHPNHIELGLSPAV